MNKTGATHKWHYFHSGLAQKLVGVEPIQPIEEIIA
jgi:hypothetical protein